MKDPEVEAELFPMPSAPEGSRVINDRCLLRTQNGRRIVIVSGIVLAHYAADDRLAEAQARVTLVEQGWADQNDVARAFECSARTVRRDQKRLDEGGLAALGRARGYPKGRTRMTLTQSVERLKPRAIPIARSRGSSVLAREQCASGCSVSDGRIRKPNRRSCLWKRLRSRSPPRR